MCVLAITHCIFSVFLVVRAVCDFLVLAATAEDLPQTKTYA